ncbi:hypothetical protein HED51_08510 [Ochrobactrum grignonense]|nr:hypothetical protein [Brucella grignonensis]
MDKIGALTIRFRAFPVFESLEMLYLFVFRHIPQRTRRISPLALSKFAQGGITPHRSLLLASAKIPLAPLIS